MTMRQAEREQAIKRIDSEDPAVTLLTRELVRASTGASSDSIGKRQWLEAQDAEQFEHVEAALGTARAHMDAGQMFFAGVDFARARRFVGDLKLDEYKARGNELCDEIYTRALQHEFCRATGLVAAIETRVSRVGECESCGKAPRALHRDEVVIWECGECKADKSDNAYVAEE